MSLASEQERDVVRNAWDGVLAVFMTSTAIHQRHSKAVVGHKLAANLGAVCAFANHVQRIHRAHREADVVLAVPLPDQERAAGTAEVPAG
jgi:hypothetical protein